MGGTNRALSCRCELSLAIPRAERRLTQDTQDTPHETRGILPQCGVDGQLCTGRPITQPIGLATVGVGQSAVRTGYK